MGSFGRILRPKLPKPLNFSPHPCGCAKERPALALRAAEGQLGRGLGGWVLDKSFFLDSSKITKIRINR